MGNAQKFVFKFAIALVLLFGIVGCDGRNSEIKVGKIEEPAQIIPIPLAKNLYDNYTIHRVPIIEFYEDSVRNRKRDNAYMQKQYEQKDDQKDDQEDDAQNKTSMAQAGFKAARYVSYDYETIKNYLKYIEQEAQAANIEISTLRFYFSNYPESKTLPGREKEINPKKNSIMISPTTKNNKGEDFLFYLDVGDNLKPRAIPLTDEFSFTDNQETGFDHSFEIKNEASLFPNFSSNAVPSLPVFAAKSVTINEGSSHP